MAIRPSRAVARACCRIDLGGGTLDIWPLGLFHDSASTVNLAIDCEATVELRLRERGYRVSQGDSLVETDDLPGLRQRDETSLLGVMGEALDLPPVEIRITTGSPRGAGLGGSSALAVAFLGAVEALTGRGPTRAADRAAFARDCEARLMRLPTGVQDHYPGLLGGVLEIAHRPGGEVVRPLSVDLDALGRHLVVAYTGVSHFSAGANWEVVRRRLEGDAAIGRLFDEITSAAAGLPEALEAEDWPAVGALVAREWAARRCLAPGVSTPEVEALLDASRDAGAWGGKACGAGGGGCVVVLAPPESRASVEAALAGAGGELLATRPSPEPLRITVD